MQGLEDKHFELPAAELAGLVTNAHERTLQCVADLEDSQWTVPLLEIVNPLLWELGHIAFFYDVFLLRLLEGSRPVMAGSDDLYNSFQVRHDDRWSLPLPSRAETLDYMRRVMESVVERLDSRQPGAVETYLYLLAVYHEDMHGEAFTYMRQTLGYAEPAFAAAGAGATPGASGGGALPGDVDVPAAVFQLGASPDAPFVFDNEKWMHSVELPAFRIARAPVTNVEFAAFVDDGGYLRPELWSNEGWGWRTRTGAQSPIHWRRGERGWLRRHFDKMVPLEEHAPVVHVNWYEAQAYCSWAGRRLPTEAEWEMAASAVPADGATGTTGYKSRYPWGDDAPTPDRANLDSRLMGCVEVGAFAAGDSAFGCRQMIGNVWEWTASAFYPFPGYVVDFPYREYSAPWFGDRQVLKGGAWATRSRLACNAYRNFFPPYRNDLFAGFRTCASS